MTGSPTGADLLLTASDGNRFAAYLARDPALPDDFVTAIRCPVLGLFGDADHAIPAAVPRALDALMSRAGVPHEIVIYPGEPHGFFELHHMGEQGHRSAAADAWERLLSFVGEQAGTC